MLTAFTAILMFGRKDYARELSIVREGPSVANANFIYVEVALSMAVSDLEITTFFPPATLSFAARWSATRALN
jgi:hypothetical protein